MRALRLTVPLLAVALPAFANDVTVGVSGRPSVVFDAATDGCASVDVPDINPRAFRDASGRVVMFALHYVNRPLRGPDFAHLRIDCHVALGSAADPDPAKFDDRNFIAATWTDDGRKVSALVHEEYHADQFDRCKASGDLACWYNTILAYRSGDGGDAFRRMAPAIVAAAPFRQDVEQGRHRGFFNPSNIVSDGAYAYALISTTGWRGQSYGNCLFRTRDPNEAGSWRAYDGQGFTIRYDNPYAIGARQPAPCQTIGPFTFPVGSLVHHRASATWIAVTQAAAGGAFPHDGFYYATSRDLLRWSAPRLLVDGKTLYNDLCTAGASIVAYPAMLDPRSTSRNFDETGDHPDLFFTTMDVAHCRTGRRKLMRERLTISVDPRS